MTAAARERRRQAAAPVRRCIVSGRRGGKAGLLRFVIDPSGAPVLDLRGTLPGRGLWVSADRASLVEAVERGAFARAARRPVAVPADLIARVETQLEAHALDLLCLARRAGAATAGFDRVRQALEQGRVAVLIEARDGAPGGRAKLRALARALPVVDSFDGSVLGRCFGRDHLVHAALAPGRLTDSFVRETTRLASVRLPADAAGSLRSTDRDVAG